LWDVNGGVGGSEGLMRLHPSDSPTE
jgi:hypothetical protein